MSEEFFYSPKKARDEANGAWTPPVEPFYPAGMLNKAPANAKQIGGQHYKGYGIQPWDYIIANKIDYLEGSAIKYITRWKEKGGIDDIRKAIHFLEKLIEVNDNGPAIIPRNRKTD